MKLTKRLLAVVLAAITVMTCISCISFTASAYNIGDTFTFGSYPQTRVTNGTTISSLNSQSASWKSLGFYSGSGSWNTANQGSFAQYCDITYGGVKYRGVKFTAYRPDSTIYATSTASNPGSLYPQYENGYRINTTYWFKYEPLKWRVLNPSTGLIICLSAIDSQAFNNQVDYQNNKYYNQNNSTTYYASDYTHSSIRTWLNNTFYSTAFSSTEQAKLISTSIANKGIYSLTGNTSHTDLDFANTTDKVFLPSYDEMIDTSKGYQQYPGDKDSLRQRQGTDYAKCMGIKVNTNTYSYWRLRTAGHDSLDTCIVNFNGQSAWANKVGAEYTYMGTVPMICCSDVKSTAPTTVTVTFNANGGSVSQSSKTVTVGSTYGTLPTPTRTNYSFQGWYDASNNKITSTTTVTRTSNHTLTAKWAANPVNVTVTFNANGGSVSQASKTVTVGSTYGTLPEPSRWGYTFQGWYDSSNNKITASTTVSIASNHTLTAHWAGQSSTVYFNANGGAVSPSSKTVTIGERYGSLPIPTRSNYTFLGWYTLTDTLVTSSTIVSTLGTHTLVAHWQETSLLPTIAIRNYVESRKVDYRTTITFSATVTNVPTGSSIHWYINGEDKGTGTDFTVKQAKSDFTVQARLIKNNVVLASSMEEQITVKHGFFDKLAAFFRALFNRLPNIVQ